MVTSGYQFMNLKFVYLSKNMPTGHQLLVTVLAYRKDCRRRFRYDFYFSCLDYFCNHPEKCGKMSQKQSTSACTFSMYAFILKWEKKTSSYFEII